MLAAIGHVNMVVAGEGNAYIFEVGVFLHHGSGVLDVRNHHDIGIGAAFDERCLVFLAIGIGYHLSVVAFGCLGKQAAQAFIGYSQRFQDSDLHRSPSGFVLRPTD